MENGVTKVEEVNSKVEESDKVVLGDGMKSIGVDDALEDANGGAESVSAAVDAEETLIKDVNDTNGVDSSVPLELDGNVDAGQSVLEKFEDAIEIPSETQTTTENSIVDPVEEIIPSQVIDEDNTSINTIKDQSVVIENDKFEDSDEHEVKEPNVSEVSDERNESVNTFSDSPSTLEDNEGINVGDSEAKVEESTSDNVERELASDLESDVSVAGVKEEAKMVEVTDISKDDPNVLEISGVTENGVNEVTKVSDPDNNEVQMSILEDIQDKKPVAEILPNSENGVSDDIHLDENVIQEDCVKGDSMSHTTQEDGEIKVEVNGDVPSQLHEKEISVTEEEVNGDVPSQLNEKEISVAEGKNDDTINKKENIGSSTNNLHNTQNEPKVEESQKEEIITPKPNSEDIIHAPSKKEPELKPTEKPTTPKPDPKPNQPSIPNSKPTLAPPPAQQRPAGLGNGAPLLEPAHRVVQSQPNGNPPLVIDEPNTEPEESDDTREKLQMIRVKFLRLARRLGQTPHNVVVAQVLYRLGLAEQLRGSNGGRVAAFSFERASAMAETLESTGQEPLEFSCTIMVLGKTGVGKSATINSIFDEVKFNTDAFQLGTKKVQDVVGTVQGIKVRVIDTPGLLSSWNDQRKNEKILHSVKKFIQKSPPDIVLYLDRLDMQSRDFGDMPLLRTITDIFGQSIWFNAIVVLTHAASAPPEGPNGTTTSYDMFVTQRSHVVQQAIRQAAGDMRLMNPVSLVENHTACRTNRAGQRVLPNGQVWKPHLLLLSFASKILVEANMLLKLQDSPPGKPFGGQRTRAPPLPFILSNLLQSRPQLNLPNEQFGDDDVDDDVSSDDDDVSEYDALPPFKRLTSVQLAKLSKVQKKAYYDELEYREKLFMKKQLKEERIRRKMMKKMAEDSKNIPEEDNPEDDSNGAATVPVAVQDMNLPVSFDADNPTHRYRALDSANQWLIRPVLDPHGWDHDVGYEGINIEHLLAVKEKIPVSFSGQVTKDKKDANLQMEISSGVKHGKSKSKSTTVAFDMQTVGKDISYTLRSDTRFLNYKKNKASAGFSVTHFGDSVTGGIKFEDKLVINRRGQLVVAGGAVIGRGDVAYGGSLEGTLRDKDYPLGRFLSTVGLSVMDWHGDLAIGWNAQSQIPIGRFTNLIGRVNLNNKGSGQVSVRLNSSEQLQIALVAFVPVVCKLIGYYQPRDTSY